MSINSLILSGNIGKQPEFKTTGDRVIASFSIATTYSVKNGDEWKNETEWTDCVAFGSTAKYIQRCNLTKGSQVSVAGEKRTNKWTGQDGNTRYSVSCIIRDFTPPQRDNKQSNNTSTAQSKQTDYSDSNEQNNGDVDEIPF